MNKIYFILFSVFFILTFSICIILSNFTEDNISNISPQEKHAKQSINSIMTMTDLEIIKKTADYLKSHGESLTFNETEIIYCCNEDESVICKDKNGEDIIYKGEYFQIKYYYNPSNNKNNQKLCIVVFLGEGNKILGYYKYNLSE